MGTKYLVLGFALVNGFLCCCATPLWEGFDEPLHYGYVESLSLAHRFPVMKQTRISNEIRKSLDLTPIGLILNSDMGNCCTTFQQWAKLSAQEKRRRIEELSDLSPELRYENSDLADWEAQQAPLAYLALAPLNAALNGVTLRNRILLLRFLCTTAATLLLYVAAGALLKELGLRNAFGLGALACIFEAEMLWASIAHVGNDWLAVPLTVAFLAALVVTANRNTTRDLLLFSGIFSAGVLTKAYFLAFAPVWVAMVAFQWLRRDIDWKAALAATAIPMFVDGPWYLHNWLLYGSISGTQQSMAGIGLRDVASAIPRIDWAVSALAFSRWSLWTGNWSFVSFSRSTLDMEALLICGGGGAYLFARKLRTQGEWWLLAACGLFALGLVYQTSATWIQTRGVSISAEPWYAQGVIVCLWVLCFAGLQASGSAGRLIAILLCLISAWIALVTYVGKLLPFYGGDAARATWHSVFDWWLGKPLQDLRGVVLGPVWLVLVLLVAFGLLLGAVTTISVMQLRRD